MLDRYLTLRPFPPGFQDPALPVAPTTHYLRPLLGDRSGPEGLPAWVAALPDRPVVYVGLGTAFNEPRDLPRRSSRGCATRRSPSIVTVGRDQDPADYGPQPEQRAHRALHPAVAAAAALRPRGHQRRLGHADGGAGPRPAAGASSRSPPTSRRTRRAARRWASAGWCRPPT